MTGVIDATTHALRVAQGTPPDALSLVLSNIAARGTIANMVAIIRNVRDIETGERQVLEHILGQQLKEDQQVILEVFTTGRKPAEPSTERSQAPSAALPEWCNVFDGLGDDEIAGIEQVIFDRADLTGTN